jgi:protein-disulfide isomerase
MVTLKLTILSFACCNPKLAPYDKQYADLIKAAAEKAGVETEIDLVHATEARMSPKYTFMAEISPLIQKYGSAVTPALFINGSLQLYGGVPTLDKLTDTFQKAKVAVEQGRL